MCENPSERAFEEGRRTGLAIAAVAAGVVSFISLLGLEKAILAVVLAVLAGRGVTAGRQCRRLAAVALMIAGLYVITFAVIMVLFHDRVAELVRLLQQLG